MNVLSLFDGISCGQVALNKVGIKYDNYFASEIDKYAIKVTQHNYPSTIQLGDVSKINGADLPKIDLLIGGSPCQGFSFAGRQLNFNDPRSALFFEFVRLIKECKPKYFLLENVKMKKEYQDIISSYLEVEPIKINSSLVSAQSRERLYWTNIPNVTQPKDKNILFSDILEKVHPKLSERRIHYSNTAKYSQDKVIDVKTKSITITTSIISRTFKDVKNNYFKLSPIECERLQTLPDDYTSVISNTQRYKCLGNGWTVDVIAHIFKNIKH
jgi:site-specific DNA-cytosine methylase